MINPIFAILLPNTLVIVMVALPCTAAKTLIINSGNDVPIATMVIPIRNSGIRYLLAMAEACFTNIPEPFTSAARESNKTRMLINVDIWL